MTTTITAVDTFTEPVTVIDDGDTASGANFQLAPQDLANRTLHNKNRIDTLDGWAQLLITSNSSIDANVVVPVTLDDSSAGFSVTSNQLTFPGAGTYLVSGVVRAQRDATADPTDSTFAIRVNSTVEFYFRSYRYSANASDVIVTALPPRTITVSDAAHTMDLYNAGTDGDIVFDSGDESLGHLFIRRLA